MATAILTLLPFAIAMGIGLVIHEKALKAVRKDERKQERRDRHKEERRKQAKRDTAEMAVLAKYYGGINNVK